MQSTSEMKIHQMYSREEIGMLNIQQRLCNPNKQEIKKNEQSHRNVGYQHKYRQGGVGRGWESREVKKEQEKNIQRKMAEKVWKNINLHMP